MNDAKLVRCIMCGQEEKIPVVIGKGSRIYLKIGGCWVRIKSLAALSFICDRCIQHNQLIDSEE